MGTVELTLNVDHTGSFVMRWRGSGLGVGLGLGLGFGLGLGLGSPPPPPPPPTLTRSALAQEFSEYPQAQYGAFHVPEVRPDLHLPLAPQPYINPIPTPPLAVPLAITLSPTQTSTLALAPALARQP